MWVRDACAERPAISWAVQSQTHIHTQVLRELPTLNSLKRLESNPLDNMFIYRLLRLMRYLRHRRSSTVTNTLENIIYKQRDFATVHYSEKNIFRREAIAVVAIT